MNSPVSSSTTSVRAWSIAIVLVIIAVWGAARNGTYTLDSVPLVRDNPQLQALDPVSIFKEDWWAAAGQPSGLYRPMAALWLGTLLKLGGGAASTLLLANVVLQALAAVLRFLVFRRLLEGRPRCDVAAAFAALLASLHPAVAEAIGSPVGAADLLASAMTWVVLWLLVQQPSALRWTLIAVASAAAVLCKESAAALPAAACAVAVLLPSEQVHRKSTVIRAIAFTLLGVIAALALRVSVLGFVGANDPVHAGFSTAARMASAMSTFATVTLPMIFSVSPMLAVIGHADVLPAAGWSDPRAFLGVALVGVALALAYFAASRGRQIWLWCLLTFLAFLLPVSNLMVATGAISASRFLIPALPWLALPLVAELFGVFRKKEADGVGIGAVIAFLLTGVTAFFAAREIAVWHSDLSLFTAERTRSTVSIHAAYNLGVSKFVQSPVEARESFRAAIDTPVVHVPGTSIPIEDLEDLRFQAAMNLGKIEIESRRDMASARLAFDRAIGIARTMRDSAAPWHTTIWREQLSAALRARASASLYAVALETSSEARAAYMGDASSDLDAATLLTPNDANLLDSKARLCLMKGDKDAFNALATRLDTEHRDSPASWGIQALRLRRDGKVDEALVYEAKSLMENLMNASPEQLLTVGKACVGSKNGELVKQGFKILDIGLARAQGNPALARAAAEAAQARREAMGQR